MAVFKDRRFYFNKCVTFPRNAMVGGDNSLRADFPLRHHRLFFCTCPRQSIWTLWDWYLYVQTFKWLIAENIIVWCICSIAIVALWNRPQERRRMSGLQRPPQFLVQDSWFCDHVKDSWINTKKTAKRLFISATFGDAILLGKFLDNETIGGGWLP